MARSGIVYLDAVLTEDQEPSLAGHVAAGRERTGARRARAWAGRMLARGRSHLLLNVLTALVTVVFCYVALRGIKLSLAWRALRTSDYWWFGAALAALALGAQARAFRWRSLFARGRRPPVGTVTNAMMIGYLYNNVMPARAGEAARVVVLTQRSTTAPVEIVGTVVLERLYDVVAILVVFFAAERWLPSVGWFGAAAIAAAVLAVAIIAAATLLAVYGDRPLRALMRPLARLPLFSGERLERTVSELTHGLSGLRHPLLALEAFVWTIVAWMATSLCAYLVALAFHLQLPFASGILVSVAIGLSMVLPSAPAAVGVFETAALVALAAYGIHHSAALPYAVVLHLVNFLPYVLVGALLLHHNSRHPVRASSQQSAPATADAESDG